MLGAPWPSAGAPLFTDDDRDAIDAVLDRRAEICPNCGTRHGEWQLPILDPHTGRQAVDDEGRLRWKMLPKPYEAEPLFCYGCKERVDGTDALPDGLDRYAYMRLVPVKRIPDERIVEAMELGWWIEDPA